MNKRLRWIVYTAVVFFILSTLDRVVLLYTSPQLHDVQGHTSGAFLLGARYDLREIGVVAVLMLLLGFIPLFDPFRSSFGKKFWSTLLSVISVLAIFMYVADIMHFAYLAQRLNASAINFIPEGGTSALMVWQTYPVIKILLIIIILSWLLIFCLLRIIKNVGRSSATGSKAVNISGGIVVFLLCALCIFGRVGQYPLRWSDAFGLGDSRLSQLALNPFQSFFSSLSFRHTNFDEKATEQYYPMMAGYFGDDNAPVGKPSFLRTIAGTAQATRPNVVLVICESFSAYKSSMWGNPLNTTPFFSTMCDNGVFFDHCFTPHFGTARGVWATVTGIPDVMLEKTASRNPLIVDQHSILNDFKGYDKDYFIGGSTSWANIKGVLENNITGINIHEQGSYTAKRVDVWGISDKNLFLQANEVLRTKTGPFFTVIQTSDNHRPYTIPEEDRAEFKTVNYPQDTLVKYGFQNNDELNAFRYTDFSFHKFIEAAGKEKYFNNTVFVFVGDHGIRGDAGNMFPQAWTANSLTCFHVPLLFYAPGLLRHERHTMVCSQVDILPTIAGITGIPYTNTAMGRDLLHLQDTNSNTAFFIDHDVRNIGVVHGSYMMQRNLANNAEQLVPIYSNDPIPADSVVSLSADMRKRISAFYETARYMLFNNGNKHK